MIKSVSKAILAVGLLLSLTAAHAQWYGEVGYVSAVIKSTSNTGRAVRSEPKLIGGFVGYEINENFAAEGFFATGLNEADVKVDGRSQTNPVVGKIPYAYGFYLKPKVKLNGNVEIFARAGYIKGKAEYSTNTFVYQQEQSDWSYGLGVNYFLTQTTYATAGWMNLYNSARTK